MRTVPSLRIPGVSTYSVSLAPSGPWKSAISARMLAALTTAPTGMFHCPALARLTLASESFAQRLKDDSLGWLVDLSLRNGQARKAAGERSESQCQLHVVEID